MDIFETIEIPRFLYQELLDCEVDPYTSDEMLGEQHQFSKAMLEAEFLDDGPAHVPMSEDAFVYLMNMALPQNMEMWYSWGDEDGESLLEAAKSVYSHYGIYCPY